MRRGAVESGVCIPDGECTSPASLTPTAALAPTYMADEWVSHTGMACLRFDFAWWRETPTNNTGPFVVTFSIA
jgi:hypothetical protein